MFNLGLFSKYRTELMGVATILIILCHMPAHKVVMPECLEIILSHGGAGCDIFLFLSGLGMYCSVCQQKASGGGFLSRYKKRYLRILMTYLLICVPIFAVLAIQNHWTIGQYLLRLSTLFFWTEGWGLWFVALILVLYLITPLLDNLFSGNKKWTWAFLLIFCTWLSGSLPAPEGVVEHIQFGLCRVPCYLLGYSLAPFVMRKKKIKITPILIVVIGLYILSQLMSKMSAIPVSFIWLEGIILLVLTIYVVIWLESSSIVIRGFAYMGKISLESYCTNVFVLPFFALFSWKVSSICINPGNWTYYIIGTLCCILISVLVNKISSYIIKRLS